MSSLAEKFLRALDQSGCNPKVNSKGWSARCPAHEDQNPSLSVSEGSDGRVLVHCHAGCKIDEICDTVGLHVSDLMPRTSFLRLHNHVKREIKGENVDNRPIRQQEKLMRLPGTR